MGQDHGISTLLNEDRRFPPPESFRKQAYVQSHQEYQKIWQESCQQPEQFWRRQANEFLHWEQPFDKVMQWDGEHALWFEGGKINVAANCLDRHLKERGDQIAISWESEQGDTPRQYTFKDLHAEVCRCAHALEQLGLEAGDCVAIYLPLIPEAVIAMLACARLGLIHNVVFAGFSAEALAERCRDSQAKLLITSDGLYRRGKVIALKQNADQAMAAAESVKNALVVKRVGEPVNMQEGRDLWWGDLLSVQKPEHQYKSFDSEHPLFVLYTSGSTGKPKGLVHSSAGYLLGATISAQYVFDLKDKDVFWCTADVGWITGHSYVTYGPLSHGNTIVLYEGAPNFPDWGRFWDIIQKYKVSVFYTAPTAIRALIKAGEGFLEGKDLSSLRLLGTVGEPINPEAWVWYHQKVGQGRCPIVDTWWQTETGSVMIAPLPGVHDAIPGSAAQAFWGVQARVADDQGRDVPVDQGGYLVIDQPWPSMARTILNDHQRYLDTYWRKIPGIYFTGDGARQDSQGNFWIMGRIDDVINVSGHRLGTMEIESALVSNPAVAEAAVVARKHELKGECIVCFVTPKASFEPSAEFAESLIQHVVSQIGALARPEEIRFAEALPKTRSGKIMRRLLRDVAAGHKTQGDLSTLEDLSVLAALHEEE